MKSKASWDGAKPMGAWSDARAAYILALRRYPARFLIAFPMKFLSALLAFFVFGLVPGIQGADTADLVLHNGKIAAVDERFSVHSAMAVLDGRIVQLGNDLDILKRRGPQTTIINLKGKLVLPGLIDSHTHPIDAALTEFDHPIPEMNTISDVLGYIRGRTRVVAPGEWIAVRQVFITRLAEQRYPTRVELDRVAPHHPVLFATGPDASLNSLALKLSDIDRDFKVTDGGAGFAERDPQTGELTGILRNATRYVKVKSSSRTPSEADKLRSVKALFADYNSVGLTAIIDRSASVEEMALFKKLRDAGPLNVRVHLFKRLHLTFPHALIK